MATFMSNFKTYIETMKYKQSFIALKSGIHEQTVSRLMTGKQEIKEDEMIKLAESVNKDITYFLDPHFKIEQHDMELSPVACYFGNASGDKEELITNLTDFAECIDSILGKKFRLEMYEEI